jgi:acyl-CoA synthetase (AMP-forming)/AMP-acid ligase II
MLTDFLEVAATSRGDALVVDGAPVSYAALWRRARGWAARYADVGVLPGEHVLLQTSRSIDLIAAQFGAWLVGAVSVPLDGSRPAAEVERAADRCVASVIVADPPVLRALDIVGDGERALLDVTVDPPLVHGPHRPVRRAEDSDALLLLTSGTTGQSKFVRFSHRAMTANTRALVDAIGWRSTDRCLTPVPAALPAVLATCVLPAFAVGATAHLVTDRTPGRLVRSITRSAPTILFAVPYTYELLCGARVCSRLAAVDSLRLCLAASAPSSPELVRHFHTLTGQRIRPMYCTSEAGSVTYVDGWEEEDDHVSVGRPLPGVQVSIVGGDDVPARPGEPGEVVVSGPLVGTGYLDEPEQSKRTFRAAGVHTGDIGVLDRRGRLRLCGRLTDTINHAGYSVSPQEVEEVLAAHPAVTEALVRGESDPLEFQRVVALVVPAAGVTLDGLTAYCAERLASYKVPQRFEVVPRLPRNAQGKLLRGSGS